MHPHPCAHRRFAGAERPSLLTLVCSILSPPDASSVALQLCRCQTTLTATRKPEASGPHNSRHRGTRQQGRGSRCWTCTTATSVHLGVSSGFLRRRSPSTPRRAPAVMAHDARMQSRDRLRRVNAGRKRSVPEPPPSPLPPSERPEVTEVRAVGPPWQASCRSGCPRFPTTVGLLFQLWRLPAPRLRHSPAVCQARRA